MHNLMQDLRYAVRSLVKQGGFSLIVILTLAVGIGASTAMFTLVNSVLLQPLTYRDPGKLVMLWERTPGGNGQNPTSPANLTGWREQSRSFTDMAAYRDAPVNLIGVGEAEEVQSRMTSGNFFAVFGAEALLGRTYQPGEDREDFVVLSHGLWRRRFGGDPAVIGRKIQVAGSSLTVVGVMPADFRSVGTKPDVWIPVSWPTDARGRFLRVVGRLRPGATLESAQAEMTGIGRRLEADAPAFNKNWSINLVAMHDQVTGDVRPALLVLLGAVGLLLLIACVNVANLLLGRAATRQREMAVRLSLGATRGRLIRQMLTESLLLSSIAGLLGLLLAVWGTAALVRLLPPDLALPRLDEVGLDGRALGFALIVSMLTGVLFGIAPALLGSSVNLSETLRQSMRGSMGGSNRLRSGLVIAEMALAVLLLVGAGLLGRSLGRLLEVDPGLRPEHVLTMRLTLSGDRYEADDARRTFMNELLNRLTALPGVRTVGGEMFLPLSRMKSATGFYVEGRPVPAEGEEPGADIRPVVGNYFQALGIPLLRGRTFDARDHATAPPTFIINEAMAKAHFPGENPVGKRLNYWWGDRVSGEIVGVVGDVREMGPTEAPAPAIYRFYDQMPAGQVSMVLRTDGDPIQLANAAAAAVKAMDPNQPVADLRPMAQVAADLVARPRLNLYLLSGFAGVALLLAALGLYGIVSYAVTQRRHEIGVRVALGALRGDILRLVVRQAMGLTGLGLLVGLLAALAATRVMASLLFGVGATDPMTFVAVGLFLVVVALLASYLPARRAALTDPMVTLRGE